MASLRSVTQAPPLFIHEELASQKHGLLNSPPMTFSGRSGRRERERERAREGRRGLMTQA